MHHRKWRAASAARVGCQWFWLVSALVLTRLNGAPTENFIVSHVPETVFHAESWSDFLERFNISFEESFLDSTYCATFQKILCLPFICVSYVNHRLKLRIGNWSTIFNIFTNKECNCKANHLISFLNSLSLFLTTLTHTPFASAFDPYSSTD